MCNPGKLLARGEKLLLDLTSYFLLANDTGIKFGVLSDGQLALLYFKNFVRQLEMEVAEGDKK